MASPSTITAIWSNSWLWGESAMSGARSCITSSTSSVPNPRRWTPPRAVSPGMSSQRTAGGHAAVVDSLIALSFVRGQLDEAQFGGQRGGGFPKLAAHVRPGIGLHRGRGTDDSHGRHKLLALEDRHCDRADSLDDHRVRRKAGRAYARELLAAAAREGGEDLSLSRGLGREPCPSADVDPDQ